MNESNRVRPLAIGLTVAGALARLMPHPWNFAPVGSISLFGGARLRGWQAFALPLALMAITDPLLGGYSVATPFVYLSFLITVWVGRRLQGTENPFRIGSASVLCSVIFFVLSNFGTWLGWYPHTGWSHHLLRERDPVFRANARQRPALHRACCSACTRG